MNHRSKFKIQNYETSEGNIGENLDVLEFDNVFLDTTPKAWPMKEIIHKLYVIKIKKALFHKRHCQENEKTS